MITTAFLSVWFLKLFYIEKKNAQRCISIIILAHIYTYIYLIAKVHSGAINMSIPKKEESIPNGDDFHNESPTRNQSNNIQHNETPAAQQHSYLTNRMLSLSTTSLTSLIPLHPLYSQGNYSSSALSLYTSQSDAPVPPISDTLARESDVTVSTNITSQAEYKGFASYVISGLVLFVWISWSILPDTFLNSIGVYYYPSRWWALAIPAYVLVLMIYMYVALALYNIEVKTVPLDDLRSVVDDTGVVITQLPGYKEQEIDKYLFNSTSGIWDLPITEVNKVFYSGNYDTELNED